MVSRNLESMFPLCAAINFLSLFSLQSGLDRKLFLCLIAGVGLGNFKFFITNLTAKKAQSIYFMPLYFMG